MLIGSQTPRLSAVPAAESSIWPQAAKLLKRMKFSLDGWQENIMSGVLGVDAERHFTAPNVLLIVPRQNGKNHILAARQLVGLFLLKERAIHTAHELGTAREHFRFLKRCLEAAGLTDKHIKYRDNNQEISVEMLDSGSKLYFKARSKDAGRGYAGFDALYFDESYALQSEQMAAILPTLSAKSMDGHTQIWYTSSAGMPGSEVLARFRDTCITGADRWAFYEWSVPEDSNISDVQNWALANPAFNIRISEDYIRANEFSAMGAEQFGRERLGIWNEEKAEAVIAPALWREGNISDEEIPDAERITLAVEVSADGTYSSLALAAGFGGADGVFIQLIAHQPGTAWVAEYIKQIQAARKVVEVVADSSGAVLGLIPELQRAGIKPRLIGLRDVQAACAGLLADIHAHRLFHTADEATRMVATAAGRRKIGETGWAWKRLGPLDVSPLVALTFAHFSWQQHAAKRVKGPARLLDIPM